MYNNLMDSIGFVAQTDPEVAEDLEDENSQIEALPQESGAEATPETTQENETETNN